MNILVTGGAGYIGSHTAKELKKAGHTPIVLDNLARGHRWAVQWGPLVEIDLASREALPEIFRRYEIEAVVHFAAYAYVGESMSRPSEYFRNNVSSTLNLLDAMCECGVKRIVFSSTCATYGVPGHNDPISENQPQRPVNPYGESKLMVERILRWYDEAYGLRAVILRYFNAAGADPDGEIGEVHDPEPHLIPRAILASLGRAPELEIFGTDYPTPDGTAIRDYVHVTDLAAAHVQALAWLANGGAGNALNLGTGRGCSVKDVIAVVEEVAQRKVPARLSPRRAGDPPVLVADATRAGRELGWKPAHASLREIVETAWRWHTSR